MREERGMERESNERRGQDWSDQITDDENDQPEEYESTYRDGSAQNECWASDR